MDFKHNISILGSTGSIGTQTLDIVRFQHIKDAVNGILSKGLTVVKIPCHLIKAAGAFMCTPGYEQAHPNTGAVSNIAIFNGCVVHFIPPGSFPGKR